MPYAWLRDFIDRLEASGRLVRVGRRSRRISR